MKLFSLITAWTFALSLFAANPSYDFILKGGHLIDPKQGIDGLRDIAISAGKIAAIAEEISPTSAKKVVNVKGLYVVPGLIDMHVHVFHGTELKPSLRNSFSSVAPDTFSFRTGVTTMVDAGSSGWRHFNTFRAQTIKNSQTRILAFLNIFGPGMIGEPDEQNLAEMSVEKTAEVAMANRDVIVGIKLAHYAGPEWDPALRAAAAARKAGLPVMIDFGRHIPELSLEKLFLEVLSPGDIFTHMYGATKGRMTLVDDNKKLRPFVPKARERGILFDVGHGGGSFVFEQAVPATEQGFFPDTISTDLHTGSMNSGMKDLLNLMSKMMSLGVSFKDAIAMTTVKPAQSIHRTDLGQLSVGSIADIAVLKMRTEKVGFFDVAGSARGGEKKLECEMTFREGRPVWDLNARAANW